MACTRKHWLGGSVSNAYLKKKYCALKECSWAFKATRSDDHLCFWPTVRQLEVSDNGFYAYPHTFLGNFCAPRNLMETTKLKHCLSSRAPCLTRRAAPLERPVVVQKLPDAFVLPLHALCSRLCQSQFTIHDLCQHNLLREIAVKQQYLSSLAF